MEWKLKGRFENIDGVPYFRMAQPVIGVDAKGRPMRPHRAERWGDGWLVTYPVSYSYNGGIVVNGKWVKGIVMQHPKVPKGYKLTSIGCGLQLNARPPYATSLFERDA